MGNTIEKLPPNSQNAIKQVIAIMSGKGGVGKSSLTGLLAVALAREGFESGILDADITGPSIPRLFGVKDKPILSNGEILPVLSRNGIRIMSLNLLLPSEDDPVIWRGPLIANTVRQFWTNVIWGKLDYLLVDLPPGTGDAPLTVMQQLPLTGIIVITSPKELAKMVVKKAVKMAGSLKTPILGLVENMSSFVCPHCHHSIKIFGESKGLKDAEEMGIPYLGSIPIDIELTKCCDRGLVEEYQGESQRKILSLLLEELDKGRNYS